MGSEATDMMIRQAIARQRRIAAGPKIRVPVPTKRRNRASKNPFKSVYPTPIGRWAAKLR